jgi:hypothetical protein
VLVEGIKARLIPMPSPPFSAKWQFPEIIIIVLLNIFYID